MNEAAPGPIAPIAADAQMPLAGFVLDLGRAQLRSAEGDTVELRPQAWAVLRHLALSAGRVVGKEELLAAIWPGLIVTDGSLTQAVSDVRAALGAAGRRVIKTVPKRGYLLVADAAATATHSPALTNLPAEVDTLIGREADTAALTQWLAQHRLVTVQGAGGIGKTRLAQAVARALVGGYAHGVWWIDLATLSAVPQIAPAIAAAANLQLGDGDAAAMLARSLAPRDALLVLDNCEHLAAGVATIARSILSAAPGVRLLATSQKLLQVPGERAYRLDTLAVPAPDTPLEAARGYSAVRLLEQRAQAADRHFEFGPDTIASAIELCRQLDGIALALEMAAARLPSLGIASVQRLVAQRLLRNADRGAPARQQTLRGTLEWSHALLEPTEQTVLRRLSVFAGSFRQEPAQQIAADEQIDAWAALDALSALVAKSLLQVGRQQPPRYRLLETTRHYAAERLSDAGETDTMFERHGRAMTALAAEIEADFWEMGDRPWLERWAPEYDDLQACFDRSCALGRVEVAALTGNALQRLDHLRSINAPRLRRAEALFRMLPGAGLNAQAWIWTCLASHGLIALDIVSRLEAASHAVACWRALNEPQRLHVALGFYAAECSRRLQFDAADAAIADRAAAWARLKLADAALMAGDLDEAIALGNSAVHRLRALDQPSNLGLALSNLCAALLLDQQRDAAAAVAAEALPLMWRNGWGYLLLDSLALLAAQQARGADAALLLGYTDAWYAAHDDQRQPNEARLAELAAADIGASLGLERLAQSRLDGAQLGDLQAEALAHDVLVHRDAPHGTPRPRSLDPVSPKE